MSFQEHYRRSTFEELSELSFHWRRKWGVKGSLFEPVRILLEEFPKNFPGFELKIVSEESHPGVKAASDRRNNRIWVNVQIWRSAKEQGDEISLSILSEEISHFVLMHPGMRFRMAYDLRAKNNPEIEYQEYEAKLFLGMLRLSVDVGENFQTSEILVHRFGFEPEVAKIYVDTLKRRRDQLACANIVRASDFRLDALSRCGRTNLSKLSGPRVDFEIDLDVSTLNGATNVSGVWVSIEQVSPKTRCRLFGDAPNGGWIDVEVEGSEPRYFLPFSGSRIRGQFIRGSTIPTIRVLAWVEKKAERLNSRIDSLRAEAVSRGFKPAPCDECQNFTVQQDGTCLPCRTCGDTNYPG